MFFWRIERINPEEIFEQGEQHYNAEEYEQAIECYEIAANHGVPDAMYSLGFCYAHRKGVPQDYSAAYYWFREAVDNGSAKAMYHLGNMYADGTFVEQDYIEAAKYYRQAARLGNVNALLALGNCYITGQGVAIDYDRALSCWTEAAARGSKEALHNIDWLEYISNEELSVAKSLVYGADDIEQDVEFGLEIINKGIRLGDSEAVFFMGTLLISGIPGYLEADITAGLHKMVEAAQQGEVTAVYSLIEIWQKHSLNGVAIEIDDAFFGKAMVDIAQTADTSEYGMNWAYAYAAWAYAHGHGVPKSESDARQWIARLPAEMQDIPFIHNLPIHNRHRE